MATLPGLPQTDEPEPDALPVEPDDGTTVPVRSDEPGHVPVDPPRLAARPRARGGPDGAQSAARRPAPEMLPMVRVWAFVIASWSHSASPRGPPIS